MLKSNQIFKGANVFMSRNLVPPEVFDALLDALKLNGADLFLCCDPFRNGPNDFHVISSPDHEKFDDLSAKGCHLLGPQCVLSCAKEHRMFPRQGFTCCLAMDGVKVLASGFDVDEKVKIEKLVTAMGGVLLSKASLDASFVVVKNVLAAKYKWALNILKKPIVTINWLHQCWNEHRVVPQEPYRMLPFSGLTISVTRIPADGRKEIEKVIIQNGGKYSPELTKTCTHLISDVPEGDKYKVARRWGHIHIVTKKWLDQSVAKKVCLNEESYPVQGGSSSSTKTVKGSSVQTSQQKGNGISQSLTSSFAAETEFPSVPPTGCSDLEATLSQNMTSMFSDPSAFTKEVIDELPAIEATDETKLDGCVANDSQSEGNDDYLSECIISLVGFEVSELRKLVNMVNRGGGSRRMLFNDKLTHIVVGAPSEVEKKQLRGLAASGVINVVKASWLEDCDRRRKEVPILRQHIGYELLIPKDPMNSTKVSVGLACNNNGKASIVDIRVASDHLLGSLNTGNVMPSPEDTDIEAKSRRNMNKGTSVEGASTSYPLNLFGGKKDKKRTRHCSSNQTAQSTKSSAVFMRQTFRFSEFFPEDRRVEIVEWISQGGGKVAGDHAREDVQFTIECHGMSPRTADIIQTTYVSSHWVRSCLEDGRLLDVSSHIIYSPLPCQVPLPGFENLRFCISQYEEKDRLLMRNLCFVLGARFVEKLTRKVTHLICKFANGPKYEAACKWGICSITCEWIYQCIRENGVVAVGLFHPKEVTSQDQEAGLCTVSQFPTQAARMVSGENQSQLMSQPQVYKNTSQVGGSGIDSIREEAEESHGYPKKTKLLENDEQNGFPSFTGHVADSISNSKPGQENSLKDDRETWHDDPNVAAALEDILEKTIKIHDVSLLGRTGCKKNPFPAEYSIVSEDHGGSHSGVGLPKLWLSRAGKREDLPDLSGDVKGGIYDNFSETQTESQVVGYEEDLSGRQMLIDRVRTRSSMA